MKAARGILEPPAARPQGERGIRAALAALAAVAAAYALGIAWFDGDGPGWTRPAMVAAVLALLAASVGLWVARRPHALVGAVALAAFAATTWSLAGDATERAQTERDKWLGSTSDFPRQRGPKLTREQAEYVPKGLTRRELIARLGVPASRSVQHIANEPDMRCLLYRKRPYRDELDLHSFCFRDGRYVALRAEP